MSFGVIVKAFGAFLRLRPPLASNPAWVTRRGCATLRLCDSGTRFVRGTRHIIVHHELIVSHVHVIMRSCNYSCCFKFYVYYTIVSSELETVAQLILHGHWNYCSKGHSFLPTGYCLKKSALEKFYGLWGNGNFMQKDPRTKVSILSI